MNSCSHYIQGPWQPVYWTCITLFSTKSNIIPIKSFLSAPESCPPSFQISFCSSVVFYTCSRLQNLLNYVTVRILMNSTSFWKHIKARLFHKTLPPPPKETPILAIHLLKHTCQMRCKSSLMATWLKALCPSSIVT